MSELEGDDLSEYIKTQHDVVVLRCRIKELEAKVDLLTFEPVVAKLNGRITELETAWNKLDALTYSFDGRSDMEAIRRKALENV